MNADRQAFDETVRRAIEQHGAALGAAIPDFGVLVSIRQRRTRRMLATATVVLAVFGLGGVILATSRAEPNPTAVDAPATVGETAVSTRAEPSGPFDGDDLGSPTTVGTKTVSPIEPVSTIASTGAVEPVEYSCSDPLGEDPTGRQLFGSCEPRPADLDGDYACTDRIGSDNGVVRFSSCEPVGQLGPLPDPAGDAPFDNPDDLPVRATAYVVQADDDGLAIAEQFCVSISDLEAVNGWHDISREFPPPGVQILIPNAFDESSCDLGSYTISGGDTSRSRVADMFCVSVRALDTANVDTEGYSAFYPGLAIVIPPSSSDGC